MNTNSIKHKWMSLFQLESSYCANTDLITMQIYKCFQLSSAEKGFMSMAQQIVQQLENHIKALKTEKEKKIST